MRYMCSAVHEVISRGHGLTSLTTRQPSFTVHKEVEACDSGINNGLANGVCVTMKRANSTPRESLVANLLLHADERITTARLFVS